MRRRDCISRPKWRYPIGRKAWLKIKQHRDRCKELFIAGNHYAHYRAERCLTLERLKVLVHRDLIKKNNSELRYYKYPLNGEEVEQIAAEFAESAWA